MDSEHRCAVAPAAAVLSQLQDGPSTVSAVVRTSRCCARFSRSWRIRCARKGRSTSVRASSTRRLPPPRAAATELGITRRGKGVKILAIVDRHGLPLSVSTHAANHHEVTLVQLSFDFYMLEAKPEHLIGDRAYDSDGLDDDLKQDGVNMIAPHRSTRKLKTQDGRSPAPLSTPLARRAVLRVAAMEAAVADPLGILCHQLPGVCPTCIHHHAPQAILR